MLLNTSLDAVNTAMNQIEKSSGAYILVGEETENKSVKHIAVLCIL